MVGQVPGLSSSRAAARGLLKGGAESTTQQVMNHLSVDDGQHGVQFPERRVGNPHRVEIVVAQHDDIAELALLDRAQLGLLLEEPAVFDGVEADRLYTRNLLAGID